MKAFNIVGRMVATSAPLSAARLTWSIVRIDAA